MRDKEDNPGFVRVGDCREKHSKIDLALFGEDGRGGIVKDVTDIKAATSIVRTVVLPVLIPLLVGGIMYLLGRGSI